MNLKCLVFGHDPENKEYLYVGGETPCLRCGIIIAGASDPEEAPQ